MKKINVIIIAGFLSIGFFSNAQDLIYQSKGFGLNVSANIALGTHFRRVGINAQLFYVKNFFQANSAIRAYFNFKGHGPKKKYPELVLSQGLVFAGGNKSTLFNPFITVVSNQTGYEYSFAYAYNAYFNTAQTKQQTGIISLEAKGFYLISENDLLARGFYDRFRTAAFLLQYRYENHWQAGINCAMWTGEFHGKRQINNPHFFHGCYMDTVGGKYTNVSHGLLSAQFQYHAGYSQVAQLNAGIDAEQVRNVMQNKFIHDMVFLPKKWRKAKNCHIPMRDENGNAYLYENEQKIRKARLYLNAFGNPALFY